MIVCLGDLLLDVLVRRVAGPGNPQAVAGLAVRPGGSAANVAAWLAHTGRAAGFIGAAGADLEGDLLLADLRQRGVRVAVSRHGQAGTGLLLLETLPDGSLRPASQRGANDLLAVTPAQRRLLAAAHWLHVSAYTFYAERSRPSVLLAIAAAHGRGVQVSLDLGAPHLVRHIGERAYAGLLRAAAPDVLLANEQEATLLAAPGQAPLAALAALAPCAVLKLGPAGCAIQAGQTRLSAAAPPAEVVDPTGAGDAFAAGFIGALVEGLGWEPAANAAVLLGSRCIGILGGRPPRPERRRTHAL